MATNVSTTFGIETFEAQGYFDDDRYRLQVYLSNSTIITINDTAVSSRTGAQNTMFLFAENEHLHHRRKRLK